MTPHQPIRRGQVPDQKRPRSQATQCEASGCDQATREGKPYCLDHVKSMPYVNEVLSRLNEQQKEIRAVQRRGPRAADVDGSNCTELLRHLEIHGPRTIERLRREVFSTIEDAGVVRSFAKALEKAGKVYLRENTRGSIVVHAYQIRVVS